MVGPEKKKKRLFSDASFLTPGGEGVQISEVWEPPKKRRGLRNLVWLETGNRIHGHMKKRHHTALKSINLLGETKSLSDILNLVWFKFG